MQTIIYIIGGYCLIKAVIHEWAAIGSIVNGDPDWGKILNNAGVTAILFLATIEAFNQ